MRLVHKLEQLVDDRFEKLPVRLQEPRILPDNVHDIRGADGLVVFAALHFSQAKEVFYNSDQEPLLSFLVCREVSAQRRECTSELTHGA